MKSLVRAPITCHKCKVLRSAYDFEPFYRRSRLPICNVCVREHQQARHAAYRVVEAPADVKQQTRMRTAYLIRRGIIQRQPCEKCGGRAEAHHTDYRDPYAVRWFCRADHEAMHHPQRSRTDWRRYPS